MSVFRPIQKDGKGS